MTVPDPMTPAEADLQDFPFMPLHVARLRDSDLAAEEDPEACWYAVLLWSASWHQLPAGSLPNNEAVLCKLLGLGRDVRTFRKHRAGALRGWVLCSDGRYYHPVVAEQVATAWDGKVRQRHKTFCAAVRKHNERAEKEDRSQDRVEAPSYEAWLSLDCPANVAAFVTAMSRVTCAGQERDNGSKGKGQGQGQGEPKEGSVADATAAAPASPPTPMDLKSAIFGSGVPLLLGAGMSRDKAASMLGRWRKSYSDGAVLDALAVCQVEAASDPIPFITRTLETRNGNRSANREPEFSAGLRAALEYGAGDHAG